GRLLGVLVGGGAPFAVEVTRIPVGDQGCPVVVVHRGGRVSAIGGHAWPCRGDPDAGCGPPGRPPRRRIPPVPSRGEGVVVPEAGADVRTLRPERCPRDVISPPAGGDRPRPPRRHRPPAGARRRA